MPASAWPPSPQGSSTSAQGNQTPAPNSRVRWPDNRNTGSYNTPASVIFQPHRGGQPGTRLPSSQVIASSQPSAPLASSPRAPYAQFDGSGFVQPSLVEFPSEDGHYTIHAQLFLPKGVSPNASAHALPAIVFTHGGSERQMYAAMQLACEGALKALV